MTKMNLFATCPFYLEELLRDELETLGADSFKIAHGGVAFEGSIETAYRACLWSRIANRILLPLKSFEAKETEDIRAAAESFEWEDHIPENASFAVDATLSKTKICTPDYAALSVKDGLVDRARKRTGTRPSVSVNNPDVRLHLHITLKEGVISLDLSGGGLHRRGYRLDTVKAAVRENTAAAVLYRGGWKPGAELPKTFADPMCGSGTLLIEAAMIAADIAPGLGRGGYGFEKWEGHVPALWTRLKDEAKKRRSEGIDRLAGLADGGKLFYGRDLNPKAVSAARINFKASAAAGLFTRGLIDISKGDFFRDQQLPEQPGLIAVNPPYGERLGRDDNMLLFYRRLGETFKRRCGGWKIIMLTGHKQLAEAVGLRADRLNTIYNGGLRCTIAGFTVFEKSGTGAADEESQNTGGGRKSDERDRGEILLPGETASESGIPSADELSPGALMIYNRLKKNAKKLKKWLAKSGISCYRLYDADMPEYSVAVDIYPPNVVIQEYAPPKTIDPVAAAVRLRNAVLAVQAWLQVPESSVHLKTRAKQKGSRQYTKKDQGGSEKLIIREHDLKFLVDPFSYLDTGIFLDSRPLRRIVRAEAEGKSFLNLFCYTGSASVYAAAGGAVSTTSVDTSRTYLDWAEANMRLNGFRGDNHSRVRMDCMKWLEQALGRWDLIYLDPPTFSNSKNRAEIFDLQKDHEDLIRLTASKLSEDGLLIFCCNYRKFKLSENLSKDFEISEITDESLDPDFERRKSIHRCWRIKHR